LKPHSNSVAIDARCLSSGVGTYAFNLIRELRAFDRSMHLHVLSAASGKDRLGPLCDRISIVSAPLFSVREQLRIPRAAGPRKLLHCTHYNAPLLARGPLIVTIADVTPLLRPDFHASLLSRAIGARALAAIARRADHIITVSEYSRSRIVEVLDVDPGKITVAYNGVGDCFRPMDTAAARGFCKNTLGVDSSFILYVGNLRPHKNVEGLVRAFAQLRKTRGSAHPLVIVGAAKGAAAERLRQLAVDLGISGSIHFAGPLEESVLVAAYNAAAMVVLPSFEEGFGLPVVEAMSCGTPVACSRAASLPEIAGDDAAYFDPGDADEMAACMGAVLDNPERRLEMRNRGFERAARFTWSHSAKVHHGVYSRFLG
jgi:glycosyltransferase involved in cell wall biosynthesis